MKLIKTLQGNVTCDLGDPFVTVWVPVAIFLSDAPFSNLVSARAINFPNTHAHSPL